jgi:hypothetical protein
MNAAGANGWLDVEVKLWRVCARWGGDGHPTYEVAGRECRNRSYMCRCQKGSSMTFTEAPHRGPARLIRPNLPLYSVINPQLPNTGTVGQGFGREGGATAES